MKRTLIEQELRAIYDERGRLLPEEVVEIASELSHPLHPFFEWNNTVAAQKYRVQQARSLIMTVRIQEPEMVEHDIRGWVSARATGTNGHGYLPVEEVIADPQARVVLLRQMQREANSFRRRWQHMAEYAATVAGMMPAEETG